VASASCGEVDICSVRSGRNLEVHGVTAMGRFAPVVIASRFDKVSTLVLPQASLTSLESALTGAENANWVEMRGYLRQIRRRGPWNDLEVVASKVNSSRCCPPAEYVSAMVGAVIRLHGVCSANANAQRKLAGSRSMCRARRMCRSRSRPRKTL